MELSINDILDMIVKAGVRPTAQRIAVLWYIANRRTHPTAEEIFKAISGDFPSLSLTTVYNSIKALLDGNLIHELQIEAGNKRYDLKPQPRHSHFICRSCGRIFDMPYPRDIQIDTADGFDVDNVDVYLQGICPDCKSKKSH